MGLLLALLVAAPGDVASRLAEAKALAVELEFTRVIPVAKSVIEDPEATLQQRVDAYVLHGSALAVVGDPVEAEGSFRLLLRARPGFELPAETSPRIMAVFRKVQVEEQTIREQMRAIERAQVVESLAVEVDVPEEGVGGAPLPFSFRLRDPRGAVSGVRLQYRRRGDAAFSALALKLDDLGAWQGTIPGEWTASETGFTLEYYVATLDDRGDSLIAVGDESTPRMLEVSAGEVRGEPITGKWWFWTAVGVLAVGIGVGTWAIVDQASRIEDGGLGAHELVLD